MSTSLEKRFLQFGLTLACLYQIYQCVNGYFFGSSTVVLNLIIGFFFFLLLYITSRLENIAWVAVALHIIMLPILIYFWSRFGGLAGTVPMIMYVYVSLILSTLHGRLLFAVLLIYAAVFVLLTFFPAVTNIQVYEEGKMPITQVAIDFFAVALIITTYLIYLKDRLITYRARVTLRHRELQQLAVNLTEQNEELRQRQEETLNLNENLEDIVAQHIKGIEEKSRQLSEYAFINAHLLRSPICRMLGIISIMEIENPEVDLRAVKEKALRVDSIIRKVNDAM